MSSAAAPPQSSVLSPQSFLLGALTLLVAVTRLFALSRSIWDWDEALFLSAMRDYDVVHHHPHPPGFPLFVGAAKVMRLFVHDDFHALRAVSLIAALCVFPALYLLARALRFEFRGAVIAALLFSFLPNVWFWGGTAFSDVFAIVLFLFAAALLFRHDGTRWSYIAGGVLFAATLLVRPQNLLLAYPWLLASWRRLRGRRIGEVAACAAAIALLVITGYALAAHATGGLDVYIQATRLHQRYVATVDGSLNPTRPPLHSVLRDFAIDPFLAGRASYVLCIFAALAFARPRRRDFDILFTFAPNFLLAWTMLSVTGVSRLSLGYIPMHALLAADGIAVTAAAVVRLMRARGERAHTVIEAALAAVIVVRYALWMRPALAEVRAHDSPPMAAIRFVQQHVPRGSKLYVQGGLQPFVDYYLQGQYSYEVVPDEFDPGAVPEEPKAWYIGDGERRTPYAIIFRRSHDRLWGLFHRRYFESTAAPILGGPRWVAGWGRFADGWYPAEKDERGREFHWMGSRGTIALQSFGTRAQLALRLYVPIDAEAPPMLAVVFNGNVLERTRVAEANIERTYEVDSRSGAPDELRIDVDGVVNPARLGKGSDARDLGVRVDNVLWRALFR